MRDGVTLVSDVWLPVDRGQHPLIPIRTPYGRANLNEMAAELAAYFTAAGYALAKGVHRRTPVSASER